MYGKSEDYEDYQQTPHPFAAMARDITDRTSIPWHQHRRGQLVYVNRGAYIVQTSEGTWLAPPQRALWIPPEILHKSRTSGTVHLRTIYIESSAAPGLPDTCAVVPVSHFLQALILEAVKLPNDYDPDGRGGKIMALLLDEIHPETSPSLHLPIPEEPRLSNICQALIDDPSLDFTLGEWGQQVGASKRTLARLFQSKTGMTFGRWRQQARLLKAVDLLASDMPVARIAEQVGYHNPSAFSKMFRESMGVPPTQYYQFSSE